MQGDFNGSTHSSTQDASELSNQAGMYDTIPDHIQNLMQMLTHEEVQILYRLDFYCFDQAGCRKLQ